MFSLIRDHPPIKTSMVTDLEQGRELELDAIAGAVIQRARAGGVAAPILATVAALLRVKLAGCGSPVGPDS